MTQTCLHYIFLPFSLFYTPMDFTLFMCPAAFNQSCCEMETLLTGDAGGKNDRGEGCEWNKWCWMDIWWAGAEICRERGLDQIGAYVPAKPTTILQAGPPEKTDTPPEHGAWWHLGRCLSHILAWRVFLNFICDWRVFRTSTELGGYFRTSSDFGGCFQTSSEPGGYFELHL